METQNTIPARINDFLKRYPPFLYMNEDALQKLSRKVQVIYLEKNQDIFKANEKNHGIFYVVKDGAVRIYNEVGNEKINVDICDEGDVFGLRPLITKEDYILSASANEESIIYGIPIQLFLPLALDNKKVSNYLIELFASNVKDPYSLINSGKLFTAYEENQNREIFDLKEPKYSKNVVTCSPDTLINKAAKLMAKRKVGSIIVTQYNKPVGIITNKDLRNQIATGYHSVTEPVNAIMSSPVKCYQEGPTVIQAQLIMLKNDISHICITKDGTPDSELLGVLTQHDIVVAFANNPVVLLKEVKRAKSATGLRDIKSNADELLRKYLDQNLPLSEILNILNEINYAINVRAIELAIENLDKQPPVKFAWLAMGSLGRKEQLLPTDQDNALVFENVPPEDYEKTKKYFVKLAGKVTQIMHKVGFEYCPADMMASNPRWCESLDVWKKQFNSWITEPVPESLLLSTIFFDYSYVYGDTIIVTKLSDSIFEELESNILFFKFMSQDALKSPSPLGFFRQFLVESDGKHKDFFDIKSRGLMPLIDAARVLSLKKGIRNVNNTAGRFKRLAELEPNNKEVYENCAYAFKALLKFRAKQGIIHQDSGRFIELTTLSKSDKLKLKRCFKPIHDIQEILSIRYQFA